MLASTFGIGPVWAFIIVLIGTVVALIAAFASGTI